MKKILILFTLLFGSAFSVYSQDKGESQVYSLEDCLLIARKKNPDIALYKARLGLAKVQIRNAFGDFLPSASYRFNYQRDLDPSEGRKINIGGQTITISAEDPNNFSMSASVDYEIFSGFSRSAAYDNAQSSYESANFNLDFTTNTVELNIYVNYVTVIKNSQIVKVRKEDLESGKKQLEKLKAQYEAGTSAIGDVYSQEAEVGNKELQLVVAENNLATAKADLLTVMGVNPDIEADFLESSLPNNITEEQAETFRRGIGVFEKAVSEALTKRADYNSSQMLIEAAESSVTAAKAGYWPTISASGGWSWANSALSDFSEFGRPYVGLSFSLPIFQNFNVDYQVENAKMQLEQMRLEKIKSERDIRSSLRKNFLKLEASEKELDITKRSLKSAEVNYESAKERYDVGVFNITDLINANYLLVEAQINRINAVYKYYQAQKELLFQIGSL